MASSSAAFICPKCSAACSSKFSLGRHNKRFHTEDAEPKDLKTLICSACSEKFQTHFDLAMHFAETHALNPPVKLTFGSEEELQTWIKREETAGRFEFAKRQGTKKRKECVVEYYRCFRTGKFRSISKGIRAPKALRSNKINNVCPAYATVTRMSSGEIRVEACLSHFGHDNLLRRLSLPEVARQEVAQHLLEDRGVDWIIQNERRKIDGGNGAISVTRENLLTSTDVHNIKKQYGASKGNKNDNDAASVDLWVQQLKSEGHLLCFSPQDDQGCFYLGVQTAFQEQILRKNGQKVVCLDSTHGTNQYGFLLVTILVVDEYGSGVPAAWFITKSEDQGTLEHFFRALRERVGDLQLQPRFFMSDDAPAFFKAWATVFGVEKTRKLLCAWHVQRNWIEQLRKWKGCDMLKPQLFDLLREPDQATFFQKWEQLQQLINTVYLQPGFANYLKLNYFEKNRFLEWAACFRRDSPVNTNMFVEAYHKVLKHGGLYLRAKQNHRLDFLLHVLTSLSNDYMLRYTVKLHNVADCQINFRVRMLNQQHRRSMVVKSEVKVITEGKEWAVVGSRGQSYLVTKELAVCNCKTRCRYCFICPDLYSCSCFDANSRRGGCKHVHFIERLFGNGVEEPRQFASSSTSTNSTNSGPTVNWTTFLNINAELRDFEPKNPAIKAAMIKKMMELAHLKELDQAATSDTPALHSFQHIRRKAPNKSVEPQRRFCSVKRRHRK